MSEQNGFTKEENIYFALRKLYESFGYSQYKMRKFEEYSLYLDNKDFLKSEYVITFTDQNGKLMALKPDVTLSIVKNTKATSTSTEKLFYRENVYRLNANTREYKEISQMGLEFLGNIDNYGILEICSLAEKSLGVIDDSFVLDVSHIGVVKGLYAHFGIDNYEVTEKLNACIGALSAHGIKKICEEEKLNDNLCEILCKLIALNGSFADSLALIKQYEYNDTIKSAIDELELIYDAYKGTESESKIKLDFSIINNLGYYTGIIFQGYVQGIPRVVLSGGRYDKLIKKFKNDISAMGFAIYLDELAYFGTSAPAVDADVLLLYNEKSDYKAIIERAEALRKTGKSVRIEKNAPINLNYGEIIKC